ncbi:MAG: aldose 1-epimerase [Rhodothermales bacterium]|jgi:aldose 1-epimerase
MFPRSLTLAIALSLMATITTPAGTKPFGKTKDGVAVHQVTLTNANGAIARLMTRGATLTELHMPDRDGKLADVVLGFNDVAGYESDRNQYFGCSTGRVANRIAKGSFEVDGKRYQVAVNNGPNHLHGGLDRSLDKVVWNAEELDTPRGPGVRFTYSSPDGEEGYPGKLECIVTYVLTHTNALRIDYEASTDARTPVNLTNHSYFNLAGAGAPSIHEHELIIASDRITAADGDLIPTGEYRAVAGTALDFTQRKSVGKDIGALLDTAFLGYDHNYVLRNQTGKLAFAANVFDPTSGRAMAVYTDQPGIQFYTGNFLFGQMGKGGKAYAKQSALCLETQKYPDSINHANFPSVVLSPGETYTHTCVYNFFAD